MITQEELHGIFWYGDIQNSFISHILKEIYYDKTYEPYLQGKKDLIIADIGAFNGITASYFSKFAKQVYAVEPSSQSFDLLQRTIQFNKLTNVKCINKAIYIRNEKLPFGGPPGNKTMNSLHMGTWPEGKPIEEVDAITIEELFKQEGIEHVDLLKVDCEGTEMQVFGHTSFSNVADKIDVVIGEYHQWSGRNKNQLKESLESRNFNFSWLDTEASIFVATKK